MNKLSLEISNKLKNEQKYKYIKSILSDSLDNGEGEYKIFNYITSNNLNENKNNVIYGLDADLIMLSLLKSNNIYLLYEPMFLELGNKDDPFLFVNINNLKNNIKLFYNDFFPIDK